MCFSAQASFTSGTFLTVAGIATLGKSDKPEQKLFAAIPLIFAVQQFAEGILWTTLKTGGYADIQNIATHIFLVAALVIWPLAVPLSMRLMEHGKGRKVALTALTVAGGLLSAFYTFCLISYQVTPQIESFHIRYIDAFPAHIGVITFGVYVIATIAPLFISSVKRMRVFGTLVFISCLVTGIFFTEYLTSVWCFFAAAMSITIYWILAESSSRVGIFSGISADRVLARIRGRGEDK